MLVSVIFSIRCTTGYPLREHVITQDTENKEVMTISLSFNGKSLCGLLKGILFNSIPPCPAAMDSPLRDRLAHNSCVATEPDHPAMMKPAQGGQCRYPFLWYYAGAMRVFQAGASVLVRRVQENPANRDVALSSNASHLSRQ